MPRLYFVKKARKDNPVAKKGESYYWWKHAFGPKQFSKNKPERSQLTQSAFLSWLYDFEDNFEQRFEGLDNIEDIQAEANSAADEIREQMDECQCNLDNMPEHLQDTSDSGITLQERIDSLEEWASALENINDYEGEEDQIENVLQEIFDTNGTVSG